MQTMKRKIGQTIQVLSRKRGGRNQKRFFSDFATMLNARLCLLGVEGIREAKKFAQVASSVSSFFIVRKKWSYSKLCCLIEFGHPICSFIYSLYPHAFSIKSQRYILRTTSDL